MDTPVRRALVSTYDKTGVVDLCRSLAARGVEIVSTGGTSRLLAEAGIPTVSVSSVTGFPEMLNGRVKTLHPRIHGGILAVRSNPEHAAHLEAHGIPPIDLVVVNLYPFEEAASSGRPFDDVVEMIDVGGPAMVRAAAKNHAHVAVVFDPADYGAVLSEIAASGAVSETTRRRVAAKPFARIRDLASRIYDRIDWEWMRNGGDTFTMGWHPESGFIKSRWVSYNEAMILYILALGANRSPVSPSAWTAWTRGYDWKTSHGQSFLHFAPLFGHQYSHCWIDFRGIADAALRPHGIDYFENSRRATLAQQAYCAANPGGFQGYSRLVWGLTACDGPGFPPYQAYSARGAPPPENDDGTIAPTAAGQ